MRANIVGLAQARDQKQEILSKAGDLSGHQVLGDLVLVATYIEPEKSQGGIYMPQKRLDESRFQGKVGLVLKLGPMAFQYDGAYPYEGPVPSVGEWVQYRAADTNEFFMGGSGKDGSGLSCRYIHSSLIQAIIGDPLKIY